MSQTSKQIYYAMDPHMITHLVAETLFFVNLVFIKVAISCTMHWKQKASFVKV